MGFAALFLCLTAQLIQAATLTVSMMPSFSQNANQGKAAINEAIQVWGRVYGGSGTYATYTIDYGDGTAVTSGTINTDGVLPQVVAQDGSLAIPAYIGAGHIYTTGGSKTVTLSVKDSLGATASRTATIRVLTAPTHPDRVDMAIQNGLRFLYLAQTPDGSSKCYWTNNSEYGVGGTGLALMAMEENGHLAVNDSALDVYAETVQRGINNLASIGTSQVISAQNGQITDTNGNGRGIYVGSSQVYDHSLAALAIIGAYPSKAAAQAAAVPYASIGVPSTNFPGVTSFYDFAVDMMDTLLWCQSDSDVRGWHYSVASENTYDTADGSTHQWPNMVFVAVRDKWGVSAPAWAVTNSMNAYISLQDHTGDALTNLGYGACGYYAYNVWRNNGKTGGMLVAYTLGGKFVGTDNDATIGYDFIGRTWIAPPTDNLFVDINSGWPGNWYYMYGLKKGLQLQKVATITVQYDSTNSGPRDWYQDLSAWLVGNAALLDAPNVNNPGNVRIAPDLRSTASSFGQLSDGHWEGHAWYIDTSYPALQTGGAVLTLTKSVTVAVPVAVIAPVPDQSARRPSAFPLDGSASYDVDPSKSIVEWLWKLDAGANPDWTHPDASGQKVIVNPGWNTVSTHTVTLRVKDNQSTPQYSTATANIVVTLNDVPPVAVPIPSARVPQIYTAHIGDTITLDGSESYDVDGDPIVSYAWDLNGDGTYGDAADQALDTSGLNARGSTAKVKFTVAYNGQIGLKVGSQPPGGVPAKYSTNKTAIDIYASPSDLFVQSLTVTNLRPGSAADLHAIFKNDLSSGSGFTGALVRFYDGDPFGAGAQIGGNYSVDLTVGGTARLDVHALLKPGQKFAYVKVDADNIIPEWDEKNNVASIYVSNIATGALATGRSFHTATLLSNGKVLVVGGSNSGALASAELYDPAQGTWRATGSLATARYYHTATLLANGKVLVAGGYGTNGVLSSAELYDPATGVWSPAGTLAAGHYFHTATQLTNRKVLVAGGANGSGALSSAELYDPVRNTWSATGSLASGRYFHTATLLINGKVLVTAGQGNGYLASVELYDPALGTWSATGSLATARYFHSASLLTNGKVLVAGGVRGTGYLASAELYDPTLGTWSATGSLGTARYGHSALLASGKVFVASGSGTSGYLSSGELYDPALGTWRATAPLVGARRGHTSTLLPAGDVLVAGGQGRIGNLSSTELDDSAAQP